MALGCSQLWLAPWPGQPAGPPQSITLFSLPFCQPCAHIVCLVSGGSLPPRLEGAVILDHSLGLCQECLTTQVPGWSTVVFTGLYF